MAAPAGTAPRDPAAAARVVIVGAGVAGLACARALQDLARRRGRTLELTILEAAARPGGVIDTQRRDGFLIEGGPDCFISEKPWALDLCRRIGLGDQVLGTNPACRRSFVLRGRRILPVPEGYQLMAPGRIGPFITTPVLSLAGKLRAACDLILPRGPQRADESLAAFVTRRFGSEVLEVLAQPLIAGIYNADPETLSLRATMPRFLEMEARHRSIILALLRARRRAPAAHAGVSGARYSLFVTLRDGLSTLIDRLAGDLPPGSLRLGVEAAEVLRNAAPAVPPSGETAPAGTPRVESWVVGTRTGERLPADAVVLAMPAHAAAALLRRLDPGLSESLAGIEYGTSVTVSLAYRRSDIPRWVEGFGFVVPRRERRALIACSFSSVKFAGRAPDGDVLLRCFLGDGALGEAGADPGRLERAARGDLQAILGVTAEPILARTCVWPGAMARYGVGHLERVASIEQRLARHPGLALAGNGLRGVGIPDCVHSGEQAAESVGDVVA
jgi:protoporphyrinogen/coproporphyrinogen III oxidase